MTEKQNSRPWLLDVDKVTVKLAGREVLADATLQVARGEFLGLIGPNGAGKTTLLRSILGIVPISAGRISVAGISGKASIDRIGYVPQRHEFAWDYPINIHDTVLGGRTRQIGMFRSAKDADYEAVAQALEKVQLANLADRPIGELSGGQRQRVLVARALAGAPDLLLLDEPFTGLDMPSWELLLSLFEDLTNGGVSIVMSTHNLPEAMDICDRVALLRRSIRAVGTPEDLLQPPMVTTWMETFEVHRKSPLLKSVGIDTQMAAAEETAQ